MQVRILKPTPIVPYSVEVPTEVDGKTVMVPEQRGRSYHPDDKTPVDIDPAIASEWIKNGIAEDFSLPAKKDIPGDSKKVKSL